MITAPFNPGDLIVMISSPVTNVPIFYYNPTLAYTDVSNPINVGNVTSTSCSLVINDSVTSSWVYVICEQSLGWIHRSWFSKVVT